MERKKIIVIDDDALLAKTVHICLTRRGYEVKIFYNGTDAMRCLTGEKPDLLVLDIMLPDCDGWSLARFVERCEWAKNIPLIIISALEPDRAKIAEVKPFAYIQKPFEMGQFMQIVERSLAGETSLARV